MPELKRLAAAWEGAPVVVLGMNTDAVEEDARFVVQELEISYPTLKAEEIRSQYDISAFPALIIIDQRGVVRDMHVGWSPTLVEDVSGTVGALLREAAAQ